MPGDIKVQVPTGISGVITTISGVDIYMDGATHLIHSETSATRLKGRTEEISKNLEAAATGKYKVMVMGYLTWAPESRYLSVYDVAPLEAVIKALNDWRPWPWNTAQGGDGRPWPWKTEQGGDGIPWPWKSGGTDSAG